MHELARRILTGDVRAVARACRLMDEQRPGFEVLARDLFPHTGGARVIGVTGSPGTGKSSLVDGLIERLRGRGERVGVVAIDPSSPFTGGALLGDRIRMQRHALDPQVFIRSLGTRGARGGLSRSTSAIVGVLDAWGANTVLVETVGVGQAEFDVLGVADSVLVVTIPGMGDDVQANKAGILEIADVFALNKADRDGVDRAHHELEVALSLGAPLEDRMPPAIVRTVATRGEGLEELLRALDEHALFLAQTAAGARYRRERRVEYAVRCLQETVLSAVLAELEPSISELASALADRALDPYSAGQALLEKLRVDPRGRSD